MKNSCIVLEGGGLRGAFTCGVLEYLLENKLHFDRVIGVSAGACNAASYASGQKGRNWKVNIELPSDKRFMGIKYLITKGSYFNMSFIFNEIPKKLIPFDETAFYKNQAEFDIVISSLETGKSTILSKKKIEEIGLDKALIATSSIPFLSKAVNIDGELFYDGGVSDSIPARYALSKHEKAVLVLTRPRGYRKGETSSKKLIQWAFRKYPAFMNAMLNRNNAYNKTLDFCEQMEREGKLFIIAPAAEFTFGRLEKSLEKRAALYHHGYQLMAAEFEKMKEFLG
jgi:predicted patatin/cPLA2 family phospholipase